MFSQQSALKTPKNAPTRNPRQGTRTGNEALANIHALLNAKFPRGTKQ
jgi:hypothetical protein